MEDNYFIKGGFSNYFDKIPSKFADYSSRDFRDGGFRVVPPAAVRKGAFIANNVVLMPSYVNIGAYVDEGTMVDTWATVGSCAQVGKMFICPVALVLVVYWSQCRPAPPLLRITALLAHVLKLLKVSLLVKIQSSQWVYTLAKAPGFTIVKPERLPMAGFLQDQWWFPGAYRLIMAATVCIVR